MSTMAVSVDLPWEELHGNLRAFIGRRVRNDADVDDLVQRVLLQIVKGVGSLRDAERLHAWVYRTARNVIVDHYRSSSVRREVTSGAADDLEVAAGPELPADDETVALRELATCLAPLLRQLSPTYREAVILADLEGITQAESAERLGVSVSGMKSRVQRGRRQLKAVLDACCRIDLDSRGGLVGYERRAPDSCTRCDSSD
jgi:RNA polymerase sigma-70 factor, ECF subfamily